mgnify:CR=1 FL=1
MATGTIIISTRQAERYFQNISLYLKRLYNQKTATDPLKRASLINKHLPTGAKYATGKAQKKKFTITQESLFNSLLKNKSILKSLQKYINEDNELDSSLIAPNNVEKIFKSLDGKELVSLASKDTEDLKQLLNNSDEVTVISIHRNSGKTSASKIVLTNVQLKKKLLEADIIGSKIRVFLTNTGEDIILKAFNDATVDVFTRDIRKISRDIDLITSNHIPSIEDYFIGSIVDTIPNNQLSEGTIKEERKKKYKGGKLLSMAQFSALLRRAVIDDSPHGPIGGRTTHPSILTYRTGQYANSIKIVEQNFKSNIFKFFYDPLYGVHETYIAGGKRSPSKHIRQHVVELAKQVYGIKVRADRRR